MSLGVTHEAATLLRAARDRIATPERWTQGAIFRASDGMSLGGSPNGPSCMCVDGALYLSGNTAQRLGSGASLCLSMAARARGFETASKFNDAAGRTHGEVLALLDEAAALAESLAGAPT
jgi:hypothetical protein